jgi:hypothetical protein
MTTFKEIRGQLIRSVSSDPANPQVGEIWYNSTIGSLKGYRNIGDAFSSETSLPAVRASGAMSGSAYNSALVAFGTTGGAIATSLEYDGSSWTTGGTGSTARQNLGSAGTQTAGIAFGGGNPSTPAHNLSATEEYDGTSWTGGGALSTGRSAFLGSFGTQTAAAAVSGSSASPAVPGGTTATEEYNGSTWSGGGAVPTAGFFNNRGAGTQTAGLVAGGNGVPSTSSFEYNGSSWTAGGGMNTPRFAGGLTGTQTLALQAGGRDGPGVGITNSEKYDGTSWTNNPASLASGKGGQFAIGVQGLSINAGGIDSANNQTASSELFNESTLATQTLTTS